MSHTTTHAYWSQVRATSCLVCHFRKALTRDESTLQLCKPCHEDVYPARDAVRYKELRELFGYTN